MDRNINPDGTGKYALINLRRNRVEWGRTPDDDFFVIKLKDRGAEAALLAYADQYQDEDPEWAQEVRDLAATSGPHHPQCKSAD